MYQSQNKENKVNNVTRKIPRPPKPQKNRTAGAYHINLLSATWCDRIIEQQNKLDDKNAELLRTAITPKHHKIGVIIRKSKHIATLRDTYMQPASRRYRRRGKRQSGIITTARGQDWQHNWLKGISHWPRPRSRDISIVNGKSSKAQKQ